MQKNKKDTGLTLALKSQTPMHFKKNIAQGLFHRVVNALSNAYFFTVSITKVTCMLEKNQCLPQFHQLIIREMLYKILGKQNGREEVDREAIEKPVKKLSPVLRQKQRLLQMPPKNSQYNQTNEDRITIIKVEDTGGCAYFALASLKSKIPEAVLVLIYHLHLQLMLMVR